MDASTPCQTEVMTTYRRVVASVVLVAMAGSAAIVFGSKPASACSYDLSTLAEYADDVALAFAGKQTSRVVIDEVHDNGVVLTFDVDLVFKGDVGETISVRTHAQSSACGKDFSRVAKSGVAVFRWRGQPSVNQCRSVVSVEELEGVFGEGVQPVATPSISEDEARGVELPQVPAAGDSTLTSTWFIAIVTASGLILALVGALAVALTRRS